MSDEAIEKKPLNPRIWGIVGIIGGLVLLGVFIGYPLLQIHNGAESIKLHKKFIIIGIFIFIAGINLLISGKKGIAMLIEKGADIKNISIPQWIFLILTVAAATGFYIWLEKYFEGLGYK